MNTSRIFYSACAALIFSAVLIFIAAVYPGYPGNAAQTSGSVELSEPDTSYTVKAYGDKIGIFTEGSSTPIKVISVNPDTLPSDARALLEKGITVSGHKELLLLIEDYTS